MNVTVLALAQTDPWQWGFVVLLIGALCFFAWWNDTYMKDKF